MRIATFERPSGEGFSSRKCDPQRSGGCRARSSALAYAIRNVQALLKRLFSTLSYVIRNDQAPLGGDLGTLADAIHNVRSQLE